MSRPANPWSQVLRVVRRVIEMTSGDGVMSLTAFWKPPGNFYCCMVPVGLMPRLDDNDTLVDESYWEDRVWPEVMQGERSVVIASYSPGDESWRIPGWASSTQRARVVIRSPDEAPETCSRRWLRYLDRRWLRGFERHADIDAEMIVAWLDRLIEVVDRDPTATIIFGEAPVPLAAMVAEVHGEQTRWDEVWWPGQELNTWKW